MNQSFSLSSLTSPRAISLNSPFPRPTSRIPTPTSPTVSRPKGLLVPTDRTLEDFKEHWLPALGRLKVEKEVTLHGYALYALRTWYVRKSRSGTSANASGTFRVRIGRKLSLRRRGSLTSTYVDGLAYMCAREGEEGGNQRTRQGRALMVGIDVSPITRSRAFRTRRKG